MLLHEQNFNFSQRTNLRYVQTISSIFNHFQPKNTIVVTDDHLENLYNGCWSDFPRLVLRSGEDNKNLEQFAYACNELLKLGADRQTLILSVGGGVVSDLAGFVAATYMRGLRLVLIPTTVLAQVDAALGGKNGINWGSIKNLVGTIRQPEAVFLCSEWFKTLPRADYNAGFAEVVKYALIDNILDFKFLQESRELFLTQDETFLQEVVSQCVMAKTRIVEQDPEEKNIRRLLNFGHTIGHPLEKLCNLRHGEAVAVGMYLACKLSEKHAGLSPSVTQNVKELLHAYQLPTQINANPEAVLELIRHDKKKQQTHINFILLQDIAKPLIHPIDLNALREEIVTLLN